MSGGGFNPYAAAGSGPVGPPVHEPDWYEDTRLDKTYITCTCGQEWPCPTLKETRQ